MVVRWIADRWIFQTKEVDRLISYHGHGTGANLSIPCRRSRLCSLSSGDFSLRLDRSETRVTSAKLSLHLGRCIVLRPRNSHLKRSIPIRLGGRSSKLSATMDEPPAKRARLSESPRTDRTGSPGDRFAISGPATSGRPRPSVLASPRIQMEAEGRAASTFQGSLSPTVGRLPTPSRHAQLDPPGFPASSSRGPGSASSSRMPLPSIGQMSTGWTSQVTGYDPGVGPSRLPTDQGFARTDSLGMIAEHEGSDAGTVGSRDPGRERAPRSMMACECPRRDVPGKHADQLTSFRSRHS